MPAEERELRELLFLQELAVAAASTMEREEMVGLIIRETTRAMEADVCSLYLDDLERGGLVLAATNGLNPSAVGRVVIGLGEGITGSVAALRSPLAIPEVSADRRFKWIDGLDEERFTSMVSVPIEAGPRMVGVLNVQTALRRDFGADELAFLTAIAGAIAGVLERSQLQRRLEEQLAESQLSQRVHDSFTGLVLSGAGLEGILEAIAGLAEGAVGLYDPLGFRLEQGAGSGLPLRRLTVPPPLSEVGGTGPIESRQGRPSKPLSLMPVRAGGELIAVLAVEGPLSSALAGRRRALEHGATVVALEMLKERSAAEVERRLRGDLLEGLLSLGESPEQLAGLALRAERLGYRVPERSWVVLMDPDDDRQLESSSTQPLLDRLRRDLQELCRVRLPGAMVVGRSSSFVVLVPAESDAGPGLELAELESFGRSLLELAGGLTREISFSVGIGNLAETPRELARAHEEARQALRLARRGQGGGRVTSYRSLGALRLLLEVRDPAILQHFVAETLGALLAYGERHRTPLLPTLELLARERWNQRAAARRLGVHVNTLAYRIQRIESLLGVPLDDPETRVVVSIALQARSLVASSDPGPSRAGSPADPD